MRYSFAAIAKWSGWLAVGGWFSYFGYFYYSLTTGEERVSAVCAQMRRGMPVIELTALAKRHGLGPGAPKQDTKLIYLTELRSFGRHACRVELENGVVTSATYNFAD